MILKTVLEVDQDYTIFNYGPPIPQKDLKSQYRTIVTGPGMKPAPKFVLPWHSKDITGKEPPPDALIMDNLETLLATTVDKSRGNTSVSIVERFIKPRESTIFGHPVYSLDGPGSSMAVLGTHEGFFNGDFGIWIVGNNFLDGCCKPIRMHGVWRALGLRHLGV